MPLLTTFLPVVRSHSRKISQKLFFCWIGCMKVPQLQVGNFKKEVPIPKRLCFFMHVLQLWKDKKPKEWHQHYGNVYFNFTMSCVKKHKKEMTIEDAIIAEDSTLLTLDHLHLLPQKGSPETITAKLK